jgi:hypothetical protein
MKKKRPHIPVTLVGLSCSIVKKTHMELINRTTAMKLTTGLKVAASAAFAIGLAGCDMNPTGKEPGPLTPPAGTPAAATPSNPVTGTVPSTNSTGAAPAAPGGGAASGSSGSGG